MTGVDRDGSIGDEIISAAGFALSTSVFSRQDCAALPAPGSWPYEALDPTECGARAATGDITGTGAG